MPNKNKRSQSSITFKRLDKVVFIKFYHSTTRNPYIHTQATVPKGRTVPEHITIAMWQTHMWRWDEGDMEGNDRMAWWLEVAFRMNWDGWFGDLGFKRKVKFVAEWITIRRQIVAAFKILVRTTTISPCFWLIKTHPKK